ncbi:5-formyltetrahydrofolate cyclo-ligase [uncultured Thiohalocapsa sp.]|uniref:5-formyltetrahydrofolate cyclo-ligase n=1 Tax=uncultured Thiohalocapsa sp. TaxID=768990 RepID=UPI0025FB352B|nr:5-formyltetrahydrofolate cyclo-ligase [uncultured Thiohalocapsa sp.]
MTEAIDSPRALRRRLRTARRALDSRSQRAHAQAIVRNLLRARLLQGAKRVALYVAADGEPDIRQRLAGLPGRGRRWYLPVLRGHAAGRLWLVRHRPGEPLRPNRFGILEPVRRHRRIQPMHALDLILVPLVGFDAACNRLGMGAGFYDRSLAPLRRRQHWRRPRLVGIAHECQRVERLVPQPWDVPLDAVVTESGVYRAGG